MNMTPFLLFLLLASSSISIGSTRTTSDSDSDSLHEYDYEYESMGPLQPYNLTALRTLSKSVNLTWNVNVNHAIYSNLTASGHGNSNHNVDVDIDVDADADADVDIRSHVIQYRKMIRTDLQPLNPLQWITYPVPISIIHQMPMPEIQEITTLVNEHIGTTDTGGIITITSGVFWLKLDLPTPDPILPHHKLPSASVSHAIPFNATPSEFEQALLSKIQGITYVRVFRYEVGKYEQSIVSGNGAYSWRVEFRASHGPIPLFEVVKDTLTFSYGNDDGQHDQQDAFQKSVHVKRLNRGRPIVYTDKLDVKVENLEPETRYEFRVGVNYDDRGNRYRRNRNRNRKYGRMWSEMITIQTPSHIPEEEDVAVKPSNAQLKSEHVKRFAGSGRKAANNDDPDYVPGAGVGGKDWNNGMDGLVVVIAHGNINIGMTVPSRTYFYYQNNVQQYIVSDVGAGTSLQFFVDIKCWGGGGSGGSSPIHDIERIGYSNGGGGGYAQARIKVTPGEILSIYVGAGGKFNPLDYANAGSGTGSNLSSFSFGYQKGGKGGTSAMGSNAGSGGGYSGVMKSNGGIVVMAGGGGAGGTTDYCCAHGGAGSGSVGINGEAPATPVSIDDSGAFDPRNEFTPVDCESDDCIDSRDRTGLPAFHMHLDRGFAPNAVHDEMCTGGEGGGLETPGNPGNSTSYKVYYDDMIVGALRGTSGFGGKGSDGKEAGGGGGSGYFGGSGGGSGVDGCGGGGGSGYIDFTFVHADKSQLSIWDSPTVKRIAHKSLDISWKNLNYAGVGEDVRYYIIEMSQGRQGSGSEEGVCSDDFNVVNSIYAGIELELDAYIDNLYPNTPYCFRIIAVSDRGIASKSNLLIVSTSPPPQNKWWPHRPRNNYDILANTYNNNEMRCGVTDYPRPRRGHTMSFVNGKVYLFGGLTTICICKEEYSERRCGDETVFSNEVWVLHLKINIWTRLRDHSWNSSFVPRGREQHSATVLSNGNIAIIGGRSDSSTAFQAKNNTTILGDVWEMDPGHITTHNISTSSSKGDDTNQLPANLKDGHVTYHSQYANLTRGNSDDSDDLCIVKMSVKVSFYHPCIEQLGFIALFGPGSSPSSLQTSQFTGNDAKLYVRSSSDTGQCIAVNTTIEFDDTAEILFINHDWVNISSNLIQPAETLGSHFEGAKTDGQWTLAIYDKVLDGVKGYLHGWEIKMDVEYCEEKISWKHLASSENSCELGSLEEGGRQKLKLLECPSTGHASMYSHPRQASSNNIFTPRYSLSAIALHDDIFVFGGFDTDFISETWRFNYASQDWIRLHGFQIDKFNRGQVATLTPYGVIAIGGTSEKEEREENLIRLYDVITQKISELESTKLIEKPPYDRNFHGLCYIGRGHIITEEGKVRFSGDDIENNIEPGILVYAGDQGLPNHTYLGDQWLLTLEHLRSLASDKWQSDFERRQDGGCKDLLEPAKTGENMFDWACGTFADVNSDSPCHWQDVITMAWCLEQYNTFVSPF